MKSNEKKSLKWIIAGAIGIALAAGISFARGLTVNGDQKSMFTALCDGCFIAGFIYLSIGTLAWISSAGFFDIFGYAFKSLLVLFTAFKDPKKHEKYYEYKMMKETNRKEKPTCVLLVTGAVLVALAFLFWLLISK